jgi:hypothetical protein
MQLAPFRNTGPGPEGQLLINPNRDEEMRQWRIAFDCSDRQLRQAVAAVGPLVANVRRFLRDQTR